MSQPHRHSTGNGGAGAGGDYIKSWIMCGNLQRGFGSLVREPCGLNTDPYYLKVPLRFLLQLYIYLYANAIWIVNPHCQYYATIQRSLL